MKSINYVKKISVFAVITVVLFSGCATGVSYDDWNAGVTREIDVPYSEVPTYDLALLYFADLVFSPEANILFENREAGRINGTFVVQGDFLVIESKAYNGNRTNFIKYDAYIDVKENRLRVNLTRPQYWSAAYDRFISPNSLDELANVYEVLDLHLDSMQDYFASIENSFNW